MRKTGIVLIIIFLSLLVYAMVNMVPEGQSMDVVRNIVKESSSTPFQDGEKFTYEVRYNKVKIGRSTITFNGEKDLDGQKVYHITFFTKIPSLKDTEAVSYTHLTLPTKRIV